MTMIALLLLAAAVPAPVPVDIAFDAAASAGLARGEASLTAHGKTMNCRGVWLADLIAAAGLPSGQDMRGAALAAGVMAEAGDGYRVLFGAAELDPRIGGAEVLVADQCDGASADAGEMPRLVVPRDGRAARSVRGLKRLVYLPGASGTTAPD